MSKCAPTLINVKAKLKNVIPVDVQEICIKFGVISMCKVITALLFRYWFITRCIDTK